MKQPKLTASAGLFEVTQMQNSSNINTDAGSMMKSCLLSSVKNHDAVAVARDQVFVFIRPRWIVSKYLIMQCRRDGLCTHLLTY